MATPHDRTEQRMQGVGAVVIAAGILLMGAGVLVGFLVGPLGFIAVAVGLVALVVSRQYVEGRRGNVIIPGVEEEADADTVATESASPAAPEPGPREG